MFAISIVYKQWYKPRNISSTPILNAKHLKYIACRKGTIYNKDCSFGLWGRVTGEREVADINNLKETMRQISEVSKEHTIYRAVLSLTEETAVNQGYFNRQEWQELVNGRIASVAKGMDIEQKDFRWCASYHHEKGHPHVHLIFWDSSDSVRTEHIPKERFEIMSEKIRAAFNKDVFKAQLTELFGEQNKVKKELRAGANNFLGSISELTYFSDENNATTNAVNFYPKTIKNSALEQFSDDLERLLFLLPKTGQLKYQYLSPHVKKALDEVSRQVIKATTLKELVAEYMRIGKEISKTYGNSEKSIQFMQNKMESQVLKDIGNDVLTTIKDNEWLASIPQSARELSSQSADDKLDLTIKDVLTIKLSESEFSSRLNNIISEFPSRRTPQYEVLKNPQISNGLRALTLECLSDEVLRTAIINRTILTENTATTAANDGQIKESKEALPLEKKGSEIYKEVYNKINNLLFEIGARDLNYSTQEKQANAMSFLMSFCRSAQSSRLQGENGRFLMQRELSKLAQRDYLLAKKDSSNMWESESIF